MHTVFPGCAMERLHDTISAIHVILRPKSMPEINNIEKTKQELNKQSLTSSKISVLLNVLKKFQDKRAIEDKDLEHIFFIVTTFTRLCMLHKSVEESFSYNIGQVIKYMGRILVRSKNIERLHFDTLIEHLLTQMFRSSPSVRSIADAVYGLGLLAESKATKLVMSPACIKEIFSQALNPQAHANAQDLSTIIHGLGVLAQGDLLYLQSIDCSDIESSISIVLETECNSKDLSMIFHGLGIMSRAGVLRGMLTPTTVNAMLSTAVIQVFDERNTTEEMHITNVLYGLGLMVKYRLITNRINESIIQEIFNKLADSSPNAQDISNSLYGLGLMSQCGVFNKKIKARRIDSMLHRLLYCEKYILQNLVNSIYGIGLIAQASNVRDKIDAHFPSVLFESINSYSLEERHVALAVYGAGLITQAKAMRNYIDINLVTLLRKKTTNQSESVVHTTQMMQGLVYLGASLDVADKARLLMCKPTHDIKQQLLVNLFSQKSWVEHCEPEKLIGAHFVDLYLEHVNGQKFVIELDGQDFHVLPNRQPQHNDRMRDNWLKEQGITVLRYPTREQVGSLERSITQEILLKVSQNELNNPNNKIVLRQKRSLDVVISDESSETEERRTKLCASNKWTG